MRTGDFIKKAWPKLIEATGNPTAPLKLQAAHTAVMQLGEMLAGTANRVATQEISEALLSKWTDAALDNVRGTPEFTFALCGLLSEAIVAYTTQTAGG